MTSIVRNNICLGGWGCTPRNCGWIKSLQGALLSPPPIAQSHHKPQRAACAVGRPATTSAMQAAYVRQGSHSFHLYRRVPAGSSGLNLLDARPLSSAYDRAGCGLSPTPFAQGMHPRHAQRQPLNSGRAGAGCCGCSCCYNSAGGSERRSMQLCVAGVCSAT